MKLVTAATTTDLKVGTVVAFGGLDQTVTALLNTERPAVFGTGTEWAVTLTGPLGARDMAAASSHKWNVVA